MKKTVIKTKGLYPYLAVTAGVGCAASVANGAVTFFGPGAQSPDSNPATPVGLSFGSLGNGTGYLNGNGSYFTRFARDITGYFTRGSDIDSIAGAMLALYSSGLSGASAGAVLGSDQNYANISFDSNISVFEGVGQFFLDGDGGGFLVALAVNDDLSLIHI